MADIIYNAFLEAVGDGLHDMDNDTFNMALFTDAHTPAQTASVYTALTGEVANGNGYTTGGVALASVTWSQAAGTLTFDFADPAWTSSTFTARYGVVYNDTAAAKNLVALQDFLANKVVTGNTFTYQVNASGLFTMAQA